MGAKPTPSLFICNHRHRTAKDSNTCFPTEGKKEKNECIIRLLTETESHLPASPSNSRCDLVCKLHCSSLAFSYSFISTRRLALHKALPCLFLGGLLCKPGGLAVEWICITLNSAVIADFEVCHFKNPSIFNE